MLKFSVLIPVYNAERYLKQCIDSVLNQTYQELELILIDDGSGDSSSEICDEYAVLDQRVLVVHQENQGPLASRITGLKGAEGTYIIYADADDYWEPDLLEQVNDAILKYECDVVIWRYTNVTETGESLGEGVKLFQEKEVLGSSEVLSTFFRTEEMNMLWNKAIKRELINISDMEELHSLGRISFGEDMALVFIMLTVCRSFIYLDSMLYNYRYNTMGLSKLYRPNMLKDVCVSRNYILTVVQSEKCDSMILEPLLKKYFLEEYLSGLSYAAQKLSMNEMVDIALYIRTLTIYKCARNAAGHMKLNFKKRSLWFLEKNAMWSVFWIISKIYSFLNKNE